MNTETEIQTVTIATVEDYLRIIAKLQDQMGARPVRLKTTLAKFLLKHGQHFAIDAKTFAGRRMTPKQCFANAAQSVARNSKLRYCEGMILFHGITLEHAWNVTPDGEIRDPTLKDGDKIADYFGVIFSTDYLWKCCCRNKVYGLLTEANIKLFENPEEAEFA